MSMFLLYDAMVYVMKSLRVYLFKVKSSLCLIKHHAIKTYGGM
jgi:hypothetical protein